LNPIMRRLLQSPLHWPLSRWFAVLSWTGRKTGKHYSTPVSYVREGSNVFITTGDRWWRNLTGGEQVGVLVAGNRQRGIAMPVTDPAQSQAQHERLFRHHRWFRLLAGLPAVRDGGPDRVALARSIAAGRVLIRIELRSAEVGSGDYWPSDS
jgi:hypothetical protein